ncbi:hypothetical protein MMC13_003434 [Lambiella insularis]|nr:hypothetical protein [Lambiella insularis]
MRAHTQLALALIATLLDFAWAAPMLIAPGDASDLILTSKDTVNGTAVLNGTSTIIGTPTTANGTAPNNTTLTGTPKYASTKPQTLVESTAGSNVGSKVDTKVEVKVATDTSVASGQLSLSLINNYPGAAAGTVQAYVTGLDRNNALVLLQPSGTWFHPSVATSSTPQEVTTNVAISLGPYGSTTSVTLPDYISAGRIWFAANGQLQFFTIAVNNAASLVEPSAVNPKDPSAAVDWGFVELTNTAAGGLYADISYVDFVGLPLGMKLTEADGNIQSAVGLPTNAVASICADLQAQSAVDGMPWGDLCQRDASGRALRVSAPSDYLASNPTAFANYYTNYIDQVWQQYTSTPLNIITQAAAGTVACQVQTDGLLHCAGDNRAYQKPTEADIFGCNSGPFAIMLGDNLTHLAVVPRLCAAFHRATLLLDGGNAQPALGSSAYYSTTPTNWFSKTVHKYELDGKGYAFAYDDVTPADSVNQSGVVASSDPQLLTITVGGPA